MKQVCITLEGREGRKRRCLELFDIHFFEIRPVWAGIFNERHAIGLHRLAISRALPGTPPCMSFFGCLPASSQVHFQCQMMIKTSMHNRMQQEVIVRRLKLRVSTNSRSLNNIWDLKCVRVQTADWIQLVCFAWRVCSVLGCQDYRGNQGRACTAM